MSKHTPGPWRIKWSVYPAMEGLRGEIRRVDQIFGADGSVVIEKGQDYDDPGYAGSEEDGRLIAAAPDLLEALKHVRDHVAEDLPSMWQMVDDAIAKAEGK